MALDKKDKKWINKTFSRYADIIGEDFVDKIKPIAEMQESQGKLLKTTFDEVGNVKTKVTEIKIRLDKIELRLNKIESDIKQIEKNVKIKNINKIKSDIVDIRKELKQAPKKKEFKILEQKVIVLEKKLTKV